MLTNNKLLNLTTLLYVMKLGIKFMIIFYYITVYIEKKCI